MKKTLALALLPLVLALAACDDTEAEPRPTSAEVGHALKDPDNAVTKQFTAAFGDSLDGDHLDCMATVLHDAPISDEALRSIVDGDLDYRGSEADAEAIKASATDLAACVIG